MKQLFILGAGGHGKVVLDIARAMGRWEHQVFLDDGLPLSSQVMGAPVAGNLMLLSTLLKPGDDWFVAIGNNSARRQWLDYLSRFLPPPTWLIHPAAVVSPHALIGEGSVVMPGGVVNAASRIGRACIINTASSVDHDCVLGDFVHISPGAHLGGNVEVGEGSWIGIGAQVRQGIRIGAQVMVGAGATVIRNIDAGQTVAGTPARPLRRSRQEALRLHS
ncbi:MAG: acetyltransferase [Thiothrix sp.]|nr:acetyltransferase [Thiothrix sp.]HPE60911.1 acetyltransferase [Thiolinea sp.]